MSNKVPAEIAQKVKEAVFCEADKENYLAISRVDSGAFLNRLVGDANIGGVLGDYVKKAEIRHYIKDAILNRYSKDKAREAMPTDVRPVVKSAFNLSVEESHQGDKIGLYRCVEAENEGEYVVVAQGTVLKWETALKKALMFTSSKPFSKTANKVHILLLLFARHKPLSPSDRRHLEKALGYCGAKPYIVGER